MRLRCRALNLFTVKRTTDKFLKQSINKGFIKVPDQRNPIADGTLFLLDDISGLGIEYPKELITTLEKNNSPLIVYQAQELAENLVTILPESRELGVIEGGGLLAYVFLYRAGYQNLPSGLIRVERKYLFGRPVARLIEFPLTKCTLILDDILASGQTLRSAVNYQISEYPDRNTEFACLLASSNIPKGEKGYRKRERSTIQGVDKMYSSQFVNGLFMDEENKTGNKKPAILSLRYLITKAVDEQDYGKEYLSKKFGGIETAKKIQKLVKEINREPIDLLRNDPIKFLETYLRRD